MDKAILFGVALIVAGLLLYTTKLPLFTGGTLVTFYVKDSATGAPIAGAYAELICRFAGGGTIPYAGYSDSNGKVEINIGDNTPVLYWSVKASGYQDASGSGYPPSTVYMTSSVPPQQPPEQPPSENPPEYPPLQPNTTLQKYLPPLLIVAGLAFVLVGSKKQKS